MLPEQNEILLEDIIEEELPSKTFKLNMKENRCIGSIDEIEALKQSIFFMLAVERYEHEIFSWDYGMETQDLFGKPTSYILSEIKRRIEETLLQDDRIESVSDFKFETHRGDVSVTFTVTSVYGVFDDGTVVKGIV